jgi:hypothetical protein
MSDVLLPDIPDKFNLTPEFRLLAACSWVAPPALEKEQAERIVSLCRGVIDWDAFIGLVRRHGVPALAYTMLSRHAGDLVPGATREILKAGHVQSAGQALFQAAELVRLIKLFASKDIDLIPLKGVFLSHQLYGDMGMRTSCDLDILVKTEQVDLAEQILAAEGYYCDSHGSELTDRQKQHIRDHVHHYEFVHSKSGLHVELHWNFGSWLPEQMSIFMPYTTSQVWQGISVNCLVEDANLLLLCDHGARHEWMSLKWLADVACLLTRERSTSWETLRALAAEVDLQRVLAHTALMVHWIYDVPLPTELRLLIRQENLALSLSESALGALLMSGEEIATAGKSAHRLRLACHMKRLRPTLPYSLLLKSVLVPMEDFQVIKLPSSLFWLYYPLRPVLWFWRNFLISQKKLKNINE